MRVAVEPWENALFSHVLQSIRVQRCAYFHPTLHAPWAFRFKGSVTYFHFVMAGRCCVEVRGSANVVQLGVGDLVVLPRGRVHTVADARATPPTDFFELAKPQALDQSRRFRNGGSGAATELLCGGMHLEHGVTDALLAALPPLIHVKSQPGRIPRWLERTISHVLEALDSDSMCREPVVTRLADILFIQTIRSYLANHIGTVQSGWLAALRDKRVGQALTLLHLHPGEHWTVGELAGRLALSRSAFAARFSHLLGESPHRYLAGLRLSVASERLRDTDDKISIIAASAGYRSPAAFSRAFKHEFGISPAEYRRNPATRRSSAGQTGVATTVKQLAKRANGSDGTQGTRATEFMAPDPVPRVESPPR
jgi:AraC-like DNA-binding protein/mannose-6-phosphate isomerase-like protein (cupin superfamily)